MNMEKLILFVLAKSYMKFVNMHFVIGISDREQIY